MRKLHGFLTRKEPSRLHMDGSGITMSPRKQNNMTVMNMVEKFRQLRHQQQREQQLNSVIRPLEGRGIFQRRRKPRQDDRFFEKATRLPDFEGWDLRHPTENVLAKVEQILHNEHLWSVNASRYNRSKDNGGTRHAKNSNSVHRHTSSASTQTSSKISPTRASNPDSCYIGYLDNGEVIPPAHHASVSSRVKLARILDNELPVPNDSLHKYRSTKAINRSGDFPIKPEMNASGLSASWPDWYHGSPGLESSSKNTPEITWTLQNKDTNGQYRQSLKPIELRSGLVFYPSRNHESDTHHKDDNSDVKGNDTTSALSNKVSGKIIPRKSLMVTSGMRPLDLDRSYIMFSRYQDLHYLHDDLDNDVDDENRDLIVTHIPTVGHFLKGRQRPLYRVPLTSSEAAKPFYAGTTSSNYNNSGTTPISTALIRNKSKDIPSSAKQRKKSSAVTRRRLNIVVEMPNAECSFLSSGVSSEENEEMS